MEARLTFLTLPLQNSSGSWQDFVGLPRSSTHDHELSNWKRTFDKFNLFSYKQLTSIPNGERYVIYVNMYSDIIKRTPRFNFFSNNNDVIVSPVYPMPSRIWNDSNLGLVHWIIDFSTECNQLNHEYDLDFGKLVAAFNTVPKNITLITGAATRGEIATSMTDHIAANFGYNVITGYTLFTFLQPGGFDEYVKIKINDIFNKKLLDYKSLVYNRLPRQHRCVIVAHILHKKYDDCIFSLGTFDGDNPRWIDEWANYFPEYADQFTYLQKGTDIYPILEEKNVDLGKNLAQVTGWIHGYNSSFQLVTETHPVNSPHPFITEKLLKPLIMLQPFIQSGPMDNIKFLKQFGYETFDKWIDHSYDSEPDNIKRLKMVLTEFDRLQALSKQQWTQILYDMTEPILHNAYLVNLPPIHCVEKQLVPIIVKHFNAI
jgi:hypothetical protein